MKKALIIVRDDWLRSTLSDWLERDGFEPIAAWDSFIGLQIAQSQQPELMLCEVDMPNLDGFAILNELRLHPLDKKPCIVLIGQSSDASHAFALGADGFLLKSAELKDLLQMMSGCIRSLQQRRESVQDSIE